MKELLFLLALYPYDKSNRGKLSDLIRKVSDRVKLISLINAHGITALAAYNLKVSELDK